jgi:hypothetical protein
MKLFLLWVGVTNAMFDMVEAENFVESAECPDSDCIEMKEDLVLVIVTLM